MVLVLFAYSYKIWVLLPIGVHWLVMFIWIVIMGTDFHGENKIVEKVQKNLLDSTKISFWLEKCKKYFRFSKRLWPFFMFFYFSTSRLAVVVKIWQNFIFWFLSKTRFFWASGGLSESLTSSIMKLFLLQLLPHLFYLWFLCLLITSSGTHGLTFETYVFIFLFK